MKREMHVDTPQKWREIGRRMKSAFGVVDDSGPLISHFMTRGPLTVRPGTPLHRALGLMIRNDLGAIPVVDEAGLIAGLVSEGDLLRAFSMPDAIAVRDIMDPEQMTIEVDQSIIEVIDLLMANNLRRVLVREDRRLVGVVSRSDVQPSILDRLRERALRARQRKVVLLGGRRGRGTATGGDGIPTPHLRH